MQVIISPYHHKYDGSIVGDLSEHKMEQHEIGAYVTIPNSQKPVATTTYYPESKLDMSYGEPGLNLYGTVFFGVLKWEH